MDQDQEGYPSPIIKNRDDSIRLTSSPEVVQRMNKLENNMDKLQGDVQQILSLLLGNNQNQSEIRKISKEQDKTLVNPKLSNTELLKLGGHDDESSESSNSDKEVKLKFTDGNEVNLEKISDSIKQRDQEKILASNDKERKKSLGGRMAANTVNIREEVAAKNRSVKTRVYKEFGTKSEEQLHNASNIGEWLALEELIRIYMVSEGEENILVYQFIKSKRVKENLCAIFNRKVEEVYFNNLNLTPDKLDMIPYEEFRVWIQSAHRPESPSLFCSTLVKLTNALVIKESEKKVSVSLYNILNTYDTIMGMCRQMLVYYDYLELNNLDNVPPMTKGKNSIKGVMQELVPKVFGVLYDTIEVNLRKDPKTSDFKTLTFKQLIGAYMKYFEDMHRKARENVLINAPFSKDKDTETAHLLKTLTSRRGGYNTSRNSDNINGVNEIISFKEEDLEYIIDEYLALKSENEYIEEQDYLDGESNKRDSESNIYAFGNDSSNRSSSNNNSSRSLTNTKMSTTYPKEVCANDMWNGFGTCDQKCGAKSHNKEDIVRVAYERANKLITANKLDKSKLSFNANATFASKNNTSDGYNAKASFENHRPSISSTSTLEEKLNQISHISAAGNTYRLDDESMMKLRQSVLKQKVYNKNDEEIMSNINVISNEVLKVKESSPMLSDFVEMIKVKGILIINGEEFEVEILLDSGGLTKHSIVNTKIYNKTKKYLKEHEIKKTRIQLNGFNGKNDGALDTVTMFGTIGFRYNSNETTHYSEKIYLPCTVADLGETDMIICIVHLAKYFSEDMCNIFKELGKLGKRLVESEDGKVSNLTSSQDLEEGSKVIALDYLTSLMQVNMVTSEEIVEVSEEDKLLLIDQVSYN